MPIVTDSYSARTAAQLDQLHAIGLVAYIGRVPNAITREEHRALLDAGKDVAVIIEHTFDAWKLGYAKGFQLGQEARLAARGLDRPDTLGVGLAIDDDILPNQLHTALQHVAGFKAAVGGPAWVYGTAFLIDRAFAAGLVTHGMQSCSTGFYDNERVSPHAALHQHCHPDVDLNDVLADDWGQLPSPIVVPVPRPTPGPSLAQERTMLTVHGTTVVDNDHLPVIVINPKDPKQLLALYCAPFDEVPGDPNKVVDGPGVQVFNLDAPAVSIAPWNDAVDPAHKSSAVAVFYGEAGHDEVHKAALKSGLWLQ